MTEPNVDHQATTYEGDDDDISPELDQAIRNLEIPEEDDTDYGPGDYEYIQ